MKKEKVEMKEEIKIIDGTYKKDNPHQDIGKQKFRVKKFYNVEVDYEVVANSKEEAEDAVQEHGGIDKIECLDGYYGDEPVEMIYNDHNWDQQAEILGKLCKKQIQLYEVPINYNGRTYSEGKKIRWYHTLKVISTMILVRFLPFGER